MANDAVAIVEHPIATVENLGSDVVSTLSDITKVVESPGESLASLGEWFETEGVEGVTESLIEGSLELLVRQATATSGTNCANDECAGTAFHKMNSFDGHASLIHGVDGNIYPLNISAFEEKLLAEGKAELAGALTQGANLFTGVNNFLFGDARGRVLHGYTDEMAKHGVSRLRFSDVNAVPKTSMLM